MNEPDSPAETIFFGARDMPDPRDRAAWLDQACGTDRALRERVERMLSAEQQADQFLADDPLRLDKAAGSEGPGAVIGHYKLLQQIGEGGCGVVYMAEQEEPIRRRVALKVIKLGMDTRQVIARFEAERQALAMMDHPNIARVLDAGATDTGRPYFVMELVRGIRITDYCDKNNLGMRERLDLFVTVAHAIQHAHQKGIIHRDIKPSNVLVTLHDGVPVPKVIDFGVAKAIEQKLTDKTLFTQFEQFIGTPAYTSPEQAEMSGLDIDTRSDIYSLGVLLYELLVGQTPFDAKELLKSGLNEMRRIIREQEPNRPSTRLSTMLAEERTVTAQHRAVSSPELVHLLKGDLDWIVMKCLEKDRTRRYETASGLATDIRNYLHHEPVVARPPTAAYRFGKLLRRNKLAVGAAAAVAMALIAGTVVSLWQAARAKQAEQTANEEREVANEERDSAEAVLTFFRDKVMAAGRPEGESGGLGKDVTLREAMDAAESQIAESFKGRPLVEAAIRKTMGESYRHLGETGRAVELLERAYALRRRELGFTHDKTFSALTALREACKADGRPARVLPLYEELVKHNRDNFGLEAPETLSAMHQHCLALLDAGRFAQAAPLLEGILEVRRVSLKPGHPDTLSTINNLALAYLGLGKADKAVTLLEETWRLRKETLGEKHDLTLLTMINLGAALSHAGKYNEALELAKQRVEITEKSRGLQHPETLREVQGLAFAHAKLGRLDEAVPLFQRTIESHKERLGEVHPQTLFSMNALAQVYQDAGKYDQALPLYEKSLELREKKFGPNHPRTLVAKANLGLACTEAGKYDRGVPLLEEALKAQEKVLEPDHDYVRSTAHNLAGAYADVGRLDKAVALFEETIRLQTEKLGEEHPLVVDSMIALAHACHKAGKYDQSLPYFEKIRKLRERSKGPEHPDTLMAGYDLGVAFQGTGSYERSLPLLKETHERQKKLLGEKHPDTLRTLWRFGAATENVASGTLERALPIYEAALALMKATGHPDTFEGMKNLADAYRIAGKFGQAEATYRQALEKKTDDIAAMSGLARVLVSAGKLDQAEAEYQNILCRQSDNLEAMAGLAGALFARSGVADANPERAREQTAKAEQLLRDAASQARVLHRDDTPKLAKRLLDLAELHYRQRQYPEAEPLYRDALQLRQKHLGEGHKDVMSSSASLGRLLADWAWTECNSKLDVTQPPSRNVERAKEGELLLRECLKARSSGEDAAHWRTSDVKSRLGGALVSVAAVDPSLDVVAREAKFAEAETYLIESHQQLQGAKYADKKYKRDALERLTRLYEAWDKLAELAAWRQKLEAFDEVKTESPVSPEGGP
jgi:serine/threonine protein kinase/tetratricopeptide (TPR) repeat protein